LKRNWKKNELFLGGLLDRAEDKKINLLFISNSKEAFSQIQAINGGRYRLRSDTLPEVPDYHITDYLTAELSILAEDAEYFTKKIGLSFRSIKYLQEHMKENKNKNYLIKGKITILLAIKN
jgi:hypothetical protein